MDAEFQTRYLFIPSSPRLRNIVEHKGRHIIESDDNEHGYEKPSSWQYTIIVIMNC